MSTYNTKITEQVSRYENLLNALREKFKASRVQCHAYICTDGQIKITHDLGFTDLTHVFINRPKNCQYAVILTSGSDVLLVDMFELKVKPFTQDIVAPDNAVHTFPSLEAAIMYAVTVHP